MLKSFIHSMDRMGIYSLSPFRARIPNWRLLLDKTINDKPVIDHIHAELRRRVKQARRK